MLRSTPSPSPSPNPNPDPHQDELSERDFGRMLQSGMARDAVRDDTATLAETGSVVDLNQVRVRVRGRGRV